MDEVTISSQEYEWLLDSQKKAETYSRSASEAQALDQELKFRDDVTHFNSLVHSDKKVAQRIVDKYWSKYGVDSIEWMQAYVKKQEFESMKEQEEVTKADEKYNDLLEKTGIDIESDLGKKLKSEYEDLIEGKKKTAENVTKYFNKALKEVKSEIDQTKWGIIWPWFGWKWSDKPAKLTEGLNKWWPTSRYK